MAFVATAQPVDDDLRARIARHRSERPASWLAIEEPFALAAGCAALAGRADVAVVDCLTLWVGNRVHRGDADDAILAEAARLAGLMAERRLSLIVVSNEVGAGVVPGTALGVRYQGLLGQVNQLVAAAADRVTLMVAGLPWTLKDEPASAKEGPRAPEAP